MKAVYGVLLKLKEQEEIDIGALGVRSFSPGIYVYVGSAMNSVEKRLERHFSDVENRHWHIDYFSREAEAIDHLVIPEDSGFECKLAEIVSRLGEPISGFGCSDCNCGSHLFRVV